MIKLKENTIIAFSGDSITDGGRSRNMDLNHHFGHGYQYILASRIGLDNVSKKPRFINKGYSGGGVNRIYENWQADIIAHKPDIISILIGINDLFKSNFETAELFREKYEKIYSMLLEETKKCLPASKIVLVEPFYLPNYNADSFIDFSPHISCEAPFAALNLNETAEMKNFRYNEVKEYSKIVKTLADEYHAIYVPVQERMEEIVRGIDGEYLIWDGVHPTIVGHAVIAEQWYKAVEKSIGEQNLRENLNNFRRK